jgi:hypothetical protein
MDDHSAVLKAYVLAVLKAATWVHRSADLMDYL